MSEISKFYITKENGEKILCEVLFSYCDKDTDTNYVVYSDGSISETGELKYTANIYEVNNERIVFKKIKTEREWKVLNIVLNEMKRMVKECNNNIDFDDDVSDLMFSLLMKRIQIKIKQEQQ